MKVYEVKKFTKEIKYSERNEIKTGCCLEDVEPETIAKFDTLAEAMVELKKHKPECWYYEGGRLYQVTEYAVEIYSADEDGEFLSGSDFDYVYNYKFDAESDNILIQ